MADANDEIKNKLGNEYDLYSALKDKFQGFNKDGDAVFKDEAGDVTAFSKADFGKMNEQLKSDFGQKSYEDTFNQNQYEDLAKQGNKFQGFAGDNAIFRNEKGDLENFGSEGGFASFLKKQNPNATFDISKQGQSQRTKTDYAAKADFLANKEVVKQKTGSGFTGFNPQAAIQTLGGAMMSPQPELKSSVNPNIAKANNPGGTFQNFKAKQPTQPKAPAAPVYEEQPTEEYKPPSLGDMAKQMALQKAGDEFAKLKAQGSNLLEAKKDEAQDVANNAISNATGLSTQMLTNPADAAKQAALNKLTETTGLNASLLKGNIADNVQNLAEDRLKAAGAEYLKNNDPTGGLLSQYGDVKDLLSGNVEDKLKDAGINMLKDQGINYLANNTALGSYANLLNGNVVENAKDMAIDKAKSTALDYLKNNDPTGGALGSLGEYAQYANLLKGDVKENVKDLAVDKAKQAAIQKGLTAAGLDPTGGLATGALNTGKALLNGGSSADKGGAAARAAAQAAITYLSGGIVSPETLALTEKLQGKTVDTINKNIGKDAQVFAKPATQLLTDGGQLASKALNETLNAAGTIGSAQGRSLGQAYQGVKAITSGNIEEGLKGLGKGAANLAINTFLKNPVTIAKGIGNLGKAAVAKAAEAAKSVASAIGKAISWVCFTPDTEILMANGKYKKIKHIKLGEEVMLGGKVTAIGTAMANDLYYYDGVEVSEGHALYEDGVWVRVEDSKYSVKMETEEEFLVYPMATENHLVVTKGQIWADVMETDNKHNVTDEDRIAQLNSQTHANALLDKFIALYFKRRK
jgi:hypothetical protein